MAFVSRSLSMLSIMSFAAALQNGANGTRSPSGCIGGSGCRGTMCFTDWSPVVGYFQKVRCSPGYVLAFDASGFGGTAYLALNGSASGVTVSYLKGCGSATAPDLSTDVCGDVRLYVNLTSEHLRPLIAVGCANGSLHVRVTRGSSRGLVPVQGADISKTKVQRAMYCKGIPSALLEFSIFLLSAGAIVTFLSVIFFASVGYYGFCPVGVCLGSFMLVLGAGLMVSHDAKAERYNDASRRMLPGGA
jgi:hypothetical protein